MLFRDHAQFVEEEEEQFSRFYLHENVVRLGKREHANGNDPLQNTMVILLGVCMD